MEIEPLEPRELLNAALPQPVRQAMLEGLGALTDRIAELQSSGPLQQPLPLVEMSIGQALNFSQIFEDRLIAPLAGYLAGDLTPTTDELAAVLANLLTTAGGLETRVDPATVAADLYDQGGTDEIRVDLKFEAIRQLNQPLDLGAEGAQRRLSITGQTDVALEAWGTIDIAFGAVLTDPMNPQFFVRINEMKIGGAIHAFDIDVAIRAGILGGQIVDAYINLDAEAQIEFRNPDSDLLNRLTLAELTSTPLLDLIDISASGQLDARLPIQASFGALSLTGDPAFTITSVDLFDPGALELAFNGDFQQLFPFLNLSNVSLLGVLTQLGSFMRGLSASETMETEIPFLRQERLGAAIDMAQGLYARVIEPLLTEEGEPAFDTIQEFVPLLAAALGVDVSAIGAMFDPQTLELTFDLDFEHQFVDRSLPINLDLQSGPLRIQSSGSRIDLGAGMRLQATVGIDLARPTVSLMGAIVAPLNGRLSANAVMRVMASGVMLDEFGDEEDIELIIPANPSNTHRDDLVRDINDAIRNTPLAGLVAASAVDGRIVLTTESFGSAGMRIRIDNALTNTAATELGFADDQEDVQTLTDHVFLSGAKLSAEATLTGSNLTAAARVGPLGVEIRDGAASGAVDFEIWLTDGQTGTPGGRVGLGELLDAFETGDFSDYVSDPLISRSVSIELKSIRVDSDFLGTLIGTPEISLSFNDAGAGGQVMVVPNGAMGQILALQNLNINSILGALGDVGGFVSDIFTLDLLSIRLPGIDRTFQELLDIAGDLQTLLGGLESAADSTLQELEELINERLAATGGLFQPSVDLSYQNQTLNLDLNIAAHASSSLPLNLDLLSLDIPGVERFIDLSLRSPLQMAADALLGIHLAVDVSNPLLPTFYLRDSSGLSLRGKLSAPDIDLGASLGGLGVFVKDGSAFIDDGTPARNPASWEVSLASDPVDHRYRLDELSTSLVQTQLIGAASVTLPLYYPLQNNFGGDLQLTVGSLADIPNSTTLVGPDLQTALDNLDLSLNLSAFIQGWDGALLTLENIIRNGLGDLDIPSIGKQLNKIADFIADLRQQANDELEAAASLGVAAIQSALFQAFGPSGLDWLTDADQNEIIDVNDVTLNIDSLRVEFFLPLFVDLVNVDTPLDFELGLPGLGLELDGDLLLDLGMELNLVIGIDKYEGLYIGNAPGPELIANFHASIPDFHATGHLFFLQVEAEDDALDPTSVTGQAELNITFPDSNHRLYITRLASLADAELKEVFDFKAQAQVHVNLDLLATFNQNADFPSISADFLFDWQLDTTEDPVVGTPQVSFQNIRLHLGEFFTNLLLPVARQVKKLLAPLQPILDILDMRLPVISDLARRDVTLADIAGALGQGNLERFIEAVADVTDIVDYIESHVGIGDDLYIDLGSFNLNHVDLTKPAVAPLTPNQPQPPATPPAQQLSGDAADLFAMTQDEGALFRFPLLDDPTGAFGMLLGWRFDLVFVDLPKLELSGRYRAIFPIFGPLYAFISGGYSAGIDLAFGYDTTGLFKYLESGDFSDIFDGFYVSDTDKPDGTGKDVPEAYLRGSLTAGAEINVVVARAGVEGGLFATLSLDLDDPDGNGRVYADEFLENLEHGLLCTFLPMGDLSARLVAYYQLLFSPRKEYEIAAVTLLDFNIEEEDCTPDRLENNDDISRAAPLGAAPGIHLTGASISSRNDTDWYQFEILRPQEKLNFAISFAHARGDLDFDLYDAAGNRLGHGRAKGKDRKQILVDELLPGDYFLHIYGHGGRNPYDLSIDLGDGGSQRIIYVNDPTVANPAAASYYTLAPGDDANDGLSPRHPKATLQNVLDTYVLGPNDIIVVDTGVYSAGPTVITAADQGAIWTGTPEGSNLAFSGFRLRIESANDNLLHRLGFSGIGGVGIELADDSADNTLQFNGFSMAGQGIRVATSQPNLIIDNRFTGGGAVGVMLLTGATATVRDNDIADQATGIWIEPGVTSLIRNNLIHDGAMGMNVQTLAAVIIDNDLVRNAIGALVTGALGPDVKPTGDPLDPPPNRFYSNVTGVHVPAGGDQAIVRFNDFNGNQFGLQIDSFLALILGNDIHNNQVGMTGAGRLGAPDWTADFINDIHQNNEGVRALEGSLVQFNLVHHNAAGIRVVGAADVHHNILHRNVGQGILVDGALGVLIRNNTVHVIGGDGVRLANFALSTTLRNNIIFAESGYALYVETSSQIGLDSDYNNLYSTGPARPVWYEKPFADLFDWQVEALQDPHSIGRTNPAPTRDDPLFINAAQVDYRLTPGSTSIDAGDPATSNAQEPAPHGGRINLGAYGDTPLAAASPASWLAIDYPEFYVDWIRTDSRLIRWQSYNLTGMIDIDLMEEGVGKIADLAQVSISAGQFEWAPEDSSIAPDAFRRFRIRLTSLADPAIIDLSREPFSVPPEGEEFYVDDDSNLLDQYTPLAIGDNRNTGRTSADPKASILPILDAYNATGGTIRIDSGSHIVVRNVRLTTLPGLGDDQALLITGPTFPGSAVTLDRANHYADSRLFEIRAADDVQLTRMTLLGAEIGVWVGESSADFTASYLELGLHALDGLLLAPGLLDPQIGFLIARDNGRHGLHVQTAIATVSDNEAYGNVAAGIRLENVGAALVENNFVHGNAIGVDAVMPAAGALLTIGNPLPELGRGNRATGNTRGIIAQGNVRVIGNQVSFNGIEGILLRLGADAEANTVTRNQYGIAVDGMADGDSLIESNLVAFNLEIGIVAASITRVLRNTVHTHRIGIHARDGALLGDFTGDIVGNLVYEDEYAAIQLIHAADGARIVNNTIYEVCDGNLTIIQPVQPAGVYIPWDWFDRLDPRPIPFPKPPVFINAWGGAMLQFGQPVGNLGGQFNLGGGGTHLTPTAQPVPQGESWTIPFTIRQLLMDTFMAAPDPIMGHAEIRLAAQSPSTGTITVQNIGGFLVGTVTMDLFVEYFFPQTNLTLFNPAPVKTIRNFAAGEMIDAWALYALPLQFNLQAQPQINLLNKQNLQLWGTWAQGQGFDSHMPGPTPPPARPPQTSGTTCALLGIDILESSGVFLRNNIVYVEGSDNPFLPLELNSHDISVDAQSTVAWDSDYNLLTTRYGNIGRWAETSLKTLADWRTVTMDDASSFDTGGPDLIWIDPDGADDQLGTIDDDFHLQRNLDRLTSPLDRGDGPAAPLLDHDYQPMVDDPLLTNIGLTAPPWVDLGAFELQAPDVPPTPPTITGSLPAFLHAGGVDVVPLPAITLMLSEPLNPISARSPGYYHLLEAGGNGLFGDADDLSIPLVPLYVAGSLMLSLFPAAPLEGGRFRLAIDDLPGLSDRSGMALDGDDDGFEGGRYVRDFEIQTPGLRIGPLMGGDLSEAGGVLTLNLRLTAAPSADVVVPLSLSLLGRAMIDSPTVAFTPADWSIPKTITITGLDDLFDNGDAAIHLMTMPLISTDPLYAGLDPADPLFTVIDDDQAGFIFLGVSGLQTSESGAGGSFQVRLAARPAAAVAVTLFSSDPGEGVAALTELIFTPENWDQFQTVDISGAGDLIADGTRPYRIILAPASSADPAYAGFNPPDVPVMNLDIDAAAILIDPVEGLVTSETAGAPPAQINFSLATQPLATVRISLSISDHTEALLHTLDLFITPADWNQPHTILISGLNDGLADGDVAYILHILASQSLDPAYDGIDPPDLMLLNLDDPPPSVFAGEDFSADEATLVTLPGAGSDPLGAMVAFTWRQISGPVVQLSDIHLPQPTFTAPQLLSQATLVFELEVSDGTTSLFDQITVTILADDDPPIVDAGPDVHILENSLAMLSPIVSDPDSTNLQYLWEQLAGPPIMLLDPTLPNPTFIAPQTTIQRNIELRLTVSDGTSIRQDSVIFILDPHPVAPPFIQSLSINEGDPQRSLLASVELVFSVDLGPAINAGLLHIIDLDTMLEVDLSQTSFTYDGPSRAASWQFLPPRLADGHYTIRLDASAIIDASGNPLDGNGDGLGGDDFTASFRLLLGDFDGSGERNADDIDLISAAVRNNSQSPVFDLDDDQSVGPSDRTHLIQTLMNATPGDVNLDGQVSIGDLTILAENYGLAGGWANGDFTGDGLISIGDLTLLAENYGAGGGSLTGQLMSPDGAPPAGLQAIDPPQGLKQSSDSLASWNHILAALKDRAQADEILDILDLLAG